MWMLIGTLREVDTGSNLGNKQSLQDAPLTFGTLLPICGDFVSVPR
jgi:hypothetical protein